MIPISIIKYITEHVYVIRNSGIITMPERTTNLIALGQPPSRPVSAFSYTVYAGGFVHFRNLSIGHDWANWDLGDGTVSTVRDHLYHNYKTAGNKFVRLTVGNSAGTTTSTQIIHIPSAGVGAIIAPIGEYADFSYTKSGLRVFFNDTSTVFQGTRLWNFGDGSTSTESNPIKIFLAAGTYTVTLTVNGIYTKSRVIIVEHEQLGGNLIWAVTNNISIGGDETTKITVDSTGIYVCGSDSSPGNDQWRIEKRALTNGSLIWAANSNPSSRRDVANGITVDSTGIYICGFDGSLGLDNTQWRIEKRALTDGSLIWAANSNPSSGWDVTTEITIDSTGIYVCGYDSSPVNTQWRIEKRALTDGSLIWAANSNPSSGRDEATGITVDSTGIYICGFDNSPGNIQWRIEKRALTDGSLIWAANSNPSSGWDVATGITVDSTGIYIYGYDQSPGKIQWRIEKRAIVGGKLFPSAFFTTNVNTGIAPLTVNFTDGSSGSSISWLWDFGDGNQSTSQNPSHTFTRGGIFEVVLTIKNDLGSSLFRMTIRVDEVLIELTPLPPIASFTANNNIVIPNTIINFTGTNSGGTATSWSWKINEVEFATTQNASHLFTTAGTYTVSFTVTSPLGSSTSTQVVIVGTNINPSDNRPIAVITPSVRAGFAPTTIEFSASVSTPNIFYLWNLGDGTTSTAASFSHTYRVSGIYTVTLTVRNIYGITVTTINIVIADLGLSDISVIGYYILDRANDRVLIYGKNGVFISSFGGTGSGIGRFRNPTFVLAHK